MEIITNGHEEWQELEPSDEYYDEEREIMNTGVRFTFTHKLKQDPRWKKIYVRDKDYFTRMTLNVGLFEIREEAIMDMILNMFQENKREHQNDS